MNFKIPKNTDKYYWTQHVVGKMHHYGLSEQKVLGVIRRPKRIETGIAPDTVAVMVPVGEKSTAQIAKNKEKKSAFGNYESGKPWSQEIWVLYQIHPFKSAVNRGLPTAEFNRAKNPKLQKLQEVISSPKKLTIISAWRFPGVNPEKDPIPAEIWREIEELELANLH
jgi:hypothetical protein